MIPRRLLFLLLLPGSLLAQSDREFWSANQAQVGIMAARDIRVDPKRIINESAAFLREREPEMNAEEYAVYEKMVGMLTTKPEFALKLLQNMLKAGEQPSPAFEFILGNAYYAAGDYAKTETSYRHAIERFPSFLRAWTNLGVLYYTTGRFDEAAKAFTKAVSLGDREASTFGLLAYSLEKEGNVIAAEVAYMQALSGDPGNSDWQEGLLRICVQGRQLIRAESIARTLIRGRPTEGRFWLVLANLLLLDQRRLEALAVLELAAGTGVAGPDELVLLGDLYAEQGLHPEALAIYTKLVKPVPATGEQKLLRLAQTLVAAGRTIDAENTMKALPETLSAEGTTTRRMLAAQLATAAKRWPDARRDLEAVLADQPMNGSASLALGIVHVGEGDDSRAALAFEAALRQPETAYRASLELANLEMRNRHYSRSVAHLQKALSIEQSDAVQEYLDRVKTLVPDDDPRSP